MLGALRLRLTCKYAARGRWRGTVLIVHDLQRVIKGIPAATERDPGLTDEQARYAVAGGGIVCNWWINKPGGQISPPEIQQKLSERALYDHLIDYDSVASDTPFISTTAGKVEVDAARARNVFFPPMYTALRFATRNFTQDSYVAHAYLYTLGRKSVELLEEFAEEVPDVNTYTAFYAWHPGGRDRREDRHPRAPHREDRAVPTRWSRGGARAGRLASARLRLQERGCLSRSVAVRQRARLPGEPMTGEMPYRIVDPVAEAVGKDRVVDSSVAPVAL